MIFIGSTICSMGGIGGAAIITPLILILESLTVKEIIPLTISIILGNSFSRVITLIFARNKNNENIYYVDLLPLFIIVPLTSTLSYLGSYLNELSSAMAIQIILIFLIFILMIKSLFKEFNKCQQESEKQDDSSNENIETLQTNILYQESIWYRLSQIGILFFISLILNIPGFFRNYINDNNLSIALETSISFTSLLIGFISTYFYKKEFNKRYMIDSQQINWFALYLFLASLIIGFATSYLGIGGGMIINPVLLGMHINPLSMISISGTTSFFSSISAIVQKISNGELSQTNLLIFGLIGLISGLIGMGLNKLIIHLTQRESYLVFILVLTMIISLIILIYNTILL